MITLKMQHCPSCGNDFNPANADLIGVSEMPEDDGFYRDLVACPHCNFAQEWPDSPCYFDKELGEFIDVFRAPTEDELRPTGASAAGQQEMDL